MRKAKWIPILLTATVCASAAMKTVDAQGGKIVYGAVDGQTTEAGAMGAMLKNLHNQYGDRPQVGKLFQVQGTQSVSAFFSIGTKHLAGIIIVAKVAESRVEAGVISGDAAHFGSNYNAMMKTLMTTWHPFEGAQQGGGSAAALHKYTTPDRTAWVELPDAWKVQQGSGGGTIMANGPNGEEADLGFGFLGSDLNNPRVQRTYQTVQNGGLRGTNYANGIYYALNNDMSRMRVDLVQMFRSKHNLPAVSVQITSSTQVQSPPRERCAHITGTGKVQSGKVTEFDEIFCVSMPTPAAGIFMVNITGTYAPAEVAAKERPTLGAVMASFSIDTAAVQRQANQYAAPAIAAIHEIGRRAAQQAADAHARNDAWNSSVYKRWDDNDKRSQAFGNYLLGYSVIRDVDNTAHGTFWNEDADLLVKTGHFEYVNTPDFWKGIDY
jgi:hypothetical protein